MSDNVEKAQAQLQAVRNFEQARDEGLTTEQRQAVLNYEAGRDLVFPTQRNTYERPFDKPVFFSQGQSYDDLRNKATQPIPPIMGDETGSQLNDILTKQNEQQKAKDTLSIANYMAQKDPKFWEEQAQLVKTFGEGFVNSPAAMQAMTFKTVNDAYNDAFSGHVLDTKILGDIAFTQYATPEQIERFATARDIQEKLNGERGFWSDIARYYRGSTAQFDAFLNFFSDHDVKTFSEDIYRASMENSRPDDGVIADTVGIVSQWINSFANHPYITAAGLTLSALGAAITRNPMMFTKGLGTTMLVTSGIDTYQMESAQNVLEILSKKTEGMSEAEKDAYLHDENEIQKLFSDVTLGTSLSTIAGTIGLYGVGKFAFGNLLKPTAKLVNAEKATQLAGKLQAKAQALTAPLAALENRPVLGAVARTGLGTVAESASEGLEGAIQKATQNAETGDPLLEGTAEAFKEDFTSSLAPMSVILGLPNSVRGMGSLLHQLNSGKNLQTLTSQRMADTAATQEGDKEHNASVYNTILQANEGDSNVTFDAQVLKQKAEEKGLDLTQIHSTFTPERVENAIATGTPLSMSRGEFISLGDDVQSVITPATAINGESLQSLQAQFTPEQIAKMRAQIETNKTEAEALEKTRNEIRADIYQEISKAVTDAKEVDGINTQASEIANIMSVFVVSLHQLTGMKINDLYNLVKPSFNIKQQVYSPDGTYAEGENPNIIGKYDPKTRTITLDRNTDSATLFHESSHWFLHALMKIGASKDKSLGTQKIRNALQGLADWSGVKDIDLDNMENKQTQQFEENFVYGFMEYVLSGRTDPHLQSIFGDFKNWLQNFRNYTLYTSRDQVEGMKAQAKGKDGNKEVYAENVRNVYRQRFGSDNAQIDQNFRDIVSMLFDNQVAADLVTHQYEGLIDIKADPNLNFDPETKAEIDKLDNEIRVNAEEQTSSLIADDTNFLISVSDKMLDKLAQRYRKKEKEMGKGLDRRWSAIKRFVENAKALKEEFAARYARHVTELINDPKAKWGIMRDIQINGINRADAKANLSPVTFRNLERKGYIKKDGLYTVDQLGQTRIDNGNGSSNNGHTVATILSQSLSPQEKAKKDVIAEMIKERKGKIDNNLVREDKQFRSYGMGIRKKLNTIFMNKVDGINKTETDVKLLDTVAKIDTLQTDYNGLQPMTFVKRAAIASKKAKQAIKNGDVAEAARQLRTERYNIVKAETAYRLRNKMEKQIDHLVKVAKTTDKKLAPRYEVNIINLMRYGLFKLGLTKNPVSFDGMDKYLEQYTNHLDENGQPVAGTFPQVADSIEAVYNSPIFKDYRSCTTEELQEALETLDKTRKQASAYKTITIDGRKIETQSAVNAAGKSLENNRKYLGNTNKTLNKDGTVAFNDVTGLRGKFRNLVVRFRNMSQGVAQEMQKIDRSHLGALFTYIYEPVRKAVSAFKLAYNESAVNYQNALKKIGRIRGDVYHTGLKDAEGHEFVLGTGDYKGRTTLQMVGLLLHIGNPENKAKLVDGYIGDNKALGEYRDPRSARTEQERKEINTYNARLYEQQIAWKNKQFDEFIQRAIKDKLITRGVLDCVDAIWKEMKRIGLDLQETAMATQGYGYKEVKTHKVSLTLPDGKWESDGGYCPLLRNPDMKNIEPEMRADTAFDSIQKGMQSLRPTTPNGFLKARTGAKYPVDIDPMRIISQSRKVLLYTYLQPAINGVMRVLNGIPDGQTKTIKEQLEEAHPAIYQDVILPWLTSVASMRTTEITTKWSTIGAVLNSATARVGQALMMLNVNNTVQQISNFATALTRCDFSDLMVGAIDLFRRHGDMKEYIFNKSQLMQVRYKEMNNGINEIMSTVTLDPSMFDNSWQKTKVGYAKVRDFMNRNAYCLQKVMQNQMDLVVWQAAEAKYIKMHKNDKGITQEQLERDAVRYADNSVVETQMSFDVSDTSAIEKSNPWVKMFIQFQGYFFNQLRLSGVESAIARETSPSNLSFMKSIAFNQACCVIMPALIAELINQSFNGTAASAVSGDEDDRDDFFLSLAFSVPKFYISSLPFAGKLLQAPLEMAEGKYYYGNSMFNNPTVTTITAGSRSLGNLAMGKDIAGKDVKNISTFIGIGLGLPVAAPVGRSLGYLTDLLEDNVDYSGYQPWLKYLDEARGVVSGQVPQSNRKD